MLIGLSQKEVQQKKKKFLGGGGTISNFVLDG
jgi:hypothetical protein